MSSNLEKGYDVALEPEIWARAGEWSANEVEYLAIGLDPLKIQECDAEATLDLKTPERKKIRARIDLVLRGRPTRRSLPPSEFLVVARESCCHVY